MQYTIEKVKNQIKDLVAAAVETQIDKQKLEITVPPEADMGDLALPCFYLAKLIKNSPNQIADELKDKIRPAGLIESVQNIGPYLNFFINPEVFGKEVISNILKQKEVYGQLTLSKDKVMLEFSQPNTHKEFHVGHLRNALLGDSLMRIHANVGYKMISANYIGDIGSHVAKCLWAFNKFHQDEELPENKGKFLGQVYTEAINKIEANEKFKLDADEVLQKLENGDKEWLALWKKTRQWSLDEFDKIYKILGIKFDYIFYESEVEKPGKKMVDQLLEKGVAHKSEGAVVIDLEKYKLKVFLLLKSDGSSLYSTKDLALAELKFKKYKVDQSIVLTDSRQDFYFEQLMKTLEIIGFNKPMQHLSYEFVTLKEGAMSSRKGNVVLFEDLYREMVERAARETRQRHQDWTDKEVNNTAEDLALSALKFNMLKYSKNSIIVFDIEEALSFDGFSGPYIQYTASRINSILKKAKIKVGSEIDFSKLTEDLEKELILKLAEYPEVCLKSLTDNEPSEITRYLFDLAKLFSAYYQKVPVINSQPENQKLRLALIKAINQILENGLNLLGIQKMKKM